MNIHKSLNRLLAMTVLVVLMSACASVGIADNGMYGAGVRAINYSKHELSYIAVEDAKDSSNAGGGDALNPYSGGGGAMICCFGLPLKWHPDLTVIVKYKIWPDKTYHRVPVKVPPYTNENAGPITLIMHADESIEVVVSRYGEGHPNWPGKPLPDPTPEQEKDMHDYELKVWNRKLKQEKAALIKFEKAVKKTDISEEKRRGYQETLDDIKKNIEYMEANKP